MNRLGFVFSTLLLLLAVASSMLFVVDQRQFGVVYALGQIKEVITEPGLNFKLPPPFQNVSYIDKRLLTLDTTDTEPMLTQEKQRVVVDWYVRWRITEPSQYIRNVGLDESAGANQLNRVVRNAFQEEINKRTVKELLSTKREALTADVKAEVLEKVRGEKPWGIDVVDVRITRADYVDAHHGIGLSPHGSRTQAGCQRVALHRGGRGRKDPRRCRPAARSDHCQCLPRRPEDQGRRRCRGGTHLRRGVWSRRAVRTVLSQPRGLQVQLLEKERRDGARPRVLRVLQGHAWQYCAAATPAAGKK
jgi:hypothetical protein